MTQRVARPMKFAAFISIILSVAVLFVACQGAVGPAGKDGKDGKDGADGADGATGPAGHTTLQLKGNSPFILISDKAGGVGDAETIDLSEYVVGDEEKTYGKPAAVGTDTDFTDDIEASIEGSMLTLKAVDGAAGQDYVINAFTVDISDTTGKVVTLTIRARRNQAPTVPAASLDDPVVGTQAPATAPATTPDCPEANECVVVLTFGDADAAAGEDKLTFTATSADTAKVEVVKVETAPDGVMARVFLKGIASTWVADTRTDTSTGDPTPGHKRVKITVTATDEDGLAALNTDGDPGEGVINIAVDGEPTAKEIPGGTLSQTASTYVIENVSGFFTNPEAQTTGGEQLTFTAKSSDTNVATVAFGTGEAPTDTSGTRLVVFRNAPGTATITVTATESDGDTPPNQTADGTFMVTVSN